ncbi:hypothetical protein B0H21DRAFT_741013 [Amylocystis lapponica]|nr:hypothetical protein B0H21DRAFT_741013 [Amylocystis lapponica]
MQLGPRPPALIHADVAQQALDDLASVLRHKPYQNMCHSKAPSTTFPIFAMRMQSPTCTNIRIRSVKDAEIILHGVSTGLLPMVTHRLDEEERMALVSGCIYVWEERPNNPLEATGQEIQRFTEGRSWGPSRARDDFLLYYEKEGTSRSSIVQRNSIPGSSGLIKQTYSVFVDSPRNTRKWHLNAYYTQETLETLLTVDEIPVLRSLRVPEGHYVCARTSGARRALRARGAVPTNEIGATRTSTLSSPNLHSDTTTSTTTFMTSPRDDRPSPTLGPRLGPATFFMATPRDSAKIHLAPLEYLQNIPPKPRDPVDDEVLRCLSRSTRLSL